MLHLIWAGPEVWWNSLRVLLASRLQSLPVQQEQGMEFLSEMAQSPHEVIVAVDGRQEGALTTLKEVAAALARLRVAIFDCSPSLVGETSELLRQAEVITTSSRGAVYALLDRGLRCVELPEETRGEEEKRSGEEGLFSAADRIHAALLEAMIRRRVGPRPAVSFVIPVYNPPPQYFREMIASIIAQDDPDWELILLDNGDPAMTAPVVQEFSDPRIRYYAGMGRRGVAMGRNFGNLLACGGMIAVMDHDDICLPGRAAAIRRAAAPDTILYGDVIHLFPDGRCELRRLPAFSPADLRRDCQIFHPSVAYSWELAAGFPYDPRFEPADDYRFYLSALRAGKSLLHLAEPLLIYRWHARQQSKAASARLQALSAAAQAEDDYLRAGGDPLDGEERFEPILVQLLAFGCDAEARALAELGYGPPRLRSTAQATAENIPLSRVLACSREPREMREAIWLTLRREGEREAATLIRRYLSAGKIDPRLQSDLAEIFLRTGLTTEANKELENLRPHGLPAFGVYLDFFLKEWSCRLGKEQGHPQLLNATAEEPKMTSIIVAAEEGSESLLLDTLSAFEGQKPLFELIVVIPAEFPLTFPSSLRPLCRIVTQAGEQNVAHLWLAGLAAARGGFLAFLLAGDRWEPGFLEHAQELMENTAADVVLGQVETPEKKILPGRTIGLSPLLKDERAFLCGCLWQRQALARIGGFIPGLGIGVGWELLLRASKVLSVVQTDHLAGRSVRLPLQKIYPPSLNELREKESSILLLKFLHRPLRYLDLEFSGAEPEKLRRRLVLLEEILSRSPELAPFLDPWLFLEEGGHPPRLLAKAGHKLLAARAFPLARTVLAAALRRKPWSAQLWFAFLRSAFR